MTSSFKPSSGLIFHRKTEHLDWRQIASIDVQNIIHSNSETEIHSILIQQLFPQITYCTIENELLQPDKPIDPGFIKVFQLAQLLIEFLSYQHLSVAERNQTLQQQYSKLADDYKKVNDQLSLLKLTLNDAKKELKKRKEMLANNQNELLGIENKDEYDQCPYCAKKFIASIYLLSHMQRRHQGLPLHPMFKVNAGTNLTYEKSVQQQQQQRVHFQNQNELQPELEKFPALSPIPSPKVMVTMSTQTSMALDDDLHPIISSRKSSVESAASASGNNLIIDETEQRITEMKQNLESQWTQLTTKIATTGIEELKSVLLDEIHKMKEIISTSVTNQEQSNITTSQPQPTTTVIENENTKINQVDEPPSSSAASNNVPKSEEIATMQILSKQTTDNDKNLEMEQRFSKQAKELEELHNLMQTKMQEDVNTFDSKLQAQERFWRMKLRQVEEQYETQALKLREEMQIFVTTQEQQQQQQQKQQLLQSSPSRRRKEEEELVIRSANESVAKEQKLESQKAKNDAIAPKIPSPSPIRSAKQSPLKVDHRSSVTVSPKKPIPKPRSTSTPIKTKGGAVAALEIVVPKEIVQSAINHEYEEPDHQHQRGGRHDAAVDHVSDYSTTDDNDDDGDKLNLTETFSEDDHHRKQKKKKKMKRQEVKVKLSPMEKIRQRVLADVDRKIKELGIDSTAVDEQDPQLHAESMAKALVELKKRRNSLRNSIKEYPEQRTQIQSELKFVALAKSIDQQLEPLNFHHNITSSSSPPPLPPGGNAGSYTKSSSPLIKMLSAVKSKGLNWKNKAVHSIKKKSSTSTSKRIDGGSGGAQTKSSVSSLIMEINNGKNNPELHQPKADRNSSFLSRTAAKFSNKYKTKQVQKDSEMEEVLDGSGSGNSSALIRRKLDEKPQYSKSMKIKNKKSKSKKDKRNEKPRTVEGEEQEEISEESTRASEKLTKLAKSLTGRRNNPETTMAAPAQNEYQQIGQQQQQHQHYQKHGVVVRRSLLKDFENVEQQQQKQQRQHDHSPKPAGISRTRAGERAEVSSEESEEEYDETEDDNISNPLKSDNASFHSSNADQGNYVKLITQVEPPRKLKNPFLVDQPPEPEQKQTQKVIAKTDYHYAVEDEEEEQNDSATSSSQMSSSDKVQMVNLAEEETDADSINEVQRQRSLSRLSSNFEALVAEIKSNNFVPNTVTKPSREPTPDQNTDHNLSSWNDTPPQQMSPTTATATIHRINRPETAIKARLSPNAINYSRSISSSSGIQQHTTRTLGFYPTSNSPTLAGTRPPISPSNKTKWLPPSGRPKVYSSPQSITSSTKRAGGTRKLFLHEPLVSNASGKANVSYNNNNNNNNNSWDSER